MMVEVTNREMSGPIECIATNGVGEPAVAGINMIVLCKLVNQSIDGFEIVNLCFNCSPTRNQT